MLGVLVHLMPATYLVDLLRGVFYQGSPVYGQMILYNPIFDLMISIALAVAFLVAGAHLFVRSERNR
jgi:ABC-2 type transport system permease protein